MSNKEKRYLGRTDEPLSEEGISKLLEYKRQGRYPEVEYLFSSPMKRCMETARILYPDLQPVSMPEWVEIDFGTFEGKNYPELQGDPQYQAWIDSNGMLPFPKGESREEFSGRADLGFLKMLEQFCKGSKDDWEISPSRVKNMGMTVYSQIKTVEMSAHSQVKTVEMPAHSQVKTVGMIVHGGIIMSLLSRYQKGDYFSYQVSNGEGFVCTLSNRSYEPEIVSIEKL